MAEQSPALPPVLFIVFNRREPALKVLEAIRNVRPGKLYIAADGPRPDRPAEQTLIDEVRRAVLAGIDWPCKVETQFQERNLGCRNGVKAAIDWFFREEERGIILEDDVVPVPEFFAFCEYALEKYHNDSEIFMISGTNPIGAKHSAEYFYSGFGGIWGWASWRRAWQKYDVEMTGWPSANLSKALRQRHGKGAAAYLEAIFNSHRKHNIDTWDTQWTYTMVKNRGMAVVPAVNLIKNIGIVGTHSSVEMRNHNLPYGRMEFPLRPRSPLIEEDDAFRSRMTREIFRPALTISVASRWAKRLRVHAILKAIYSVTRTKKVGLS